MPKSVDICIASLYRGGHCVKTVESLIEQPELNKIYLVCNNYTTRQYNYVTAQLYKYENIIILNRSNQKGCSEKFYPIKLSTAPFIGFCDDDLIYPPDYLAKLKAAAVKYRAIVSLHGSILKDGKAVNYYRHRKKVFHCMHEFHYDHEADLIGSGVCLVERSLIPLLGVLYDKVEHPNMSDIYLSYLAKQSGIKRVVINHPKGYLIHKTIEQGDNYIYDAHKNNCKPQTDFINEYFI